MRFIFVSCQEGDTPPLQGYKTPFKCVCCSECAASVWVRSIFFVFWVRGCRLLLVYEGQQEECNVMRAPVTSVRGHRRPVATLHQTLSELKVDAPLQLHCKTKNIDVIPDLHFSNSPTNASYGCLVL